MDSFCQTGITPQAILQITLSKGLVWPETELSHVISTCISIDFTVAVSTFSGFKHSHSGESRVYTKNPKYLHNGKNIADIGNRKAICRSYLTGMLCDFMLVSFVLVLPANCNNCNQTTSLRMLALKHGCDDVSSLCFPEGIGKQLAKPSQLNLVGLGRAFSFLNNAYP